MKKIKLFVMLLAFPLSLWAQEDEKRTHEFSRLRFGADVGVEMFNGATSKHSNIRENQSYYVDPYYDDMYYCGYMYDSYNYTRYNFGVKSEYSLNNRIAAAAGLRFSVNTSKLGSDRNYFLWKTEENNTTTNYVRISEIAQNNYYAGFPFELKFFPGKSDMFIRQYLKAGMLFNFLLASRNTVSFTDKSMEKYNDRIKEQIGALVSVGLFLPRTRSESRTNESSFWQYRNTTASAYI
jgi:hypothetical protein